MAASLERPLAYTAKVTTGEACEVFNSLEKRRQFFHEKKLCYNCGREGHGANYCRSRPCFKCKTKHHTSLCDRASLNRPSDGTVFTAYNPGSEDRSLPAIIPLKIQGVILWAYLDTGSGRNFISREAMKKLNLKPKRHESRQFVTINGVQKQSMPIFKVRLDSLDNSTSEQVEITGSKMEDFTTVRRPTVRELKTKYEHARDKQFYMTANEEYPIHVILGDSTYCKIRTEQTFKGRPEDPIVEGTTFGWIIHGGEEYTDNKCVGYTLCHSLTTHSYGPILVLFSSTSTTRPMSLLFLFKNLLHNHLSPISIITNLVILAVK